MTPDEKPNTPTHTKALPDKANRPVLASLKEHIAVQERGSRPGKQAWPQIPIGVDALDQALLGHGLSAGALHEFAPTTAGNFPAALGFTLGILSRFAQHNPGQILWVLSTHQTSEDGAPYPGSFASLGLEIGRFIQVRVPKPQNVLWALEEGLNHSALAAVIANLPANARSYDFTASRRLALRAATHGVTPLLIFSGPPQISASAAETRWQISSAPSLPHPFAGRVWPGLGPPRWQVDLTKTKRGVPGSWQVEWNHETFSFRMATTLVNRAPARLSVRALSPAPTRAAS